MKVCNEIDCYEVNDETVKELDAPKLKIRSHWNYDDRVVIETPNGNSFTVLIRQLKAAIENAGNHK